jgi:hypothetical protein
MNRPLRTAATALALVSLSGCITTSGGGSIDGDKITYPKAPQKMFVAPMQTCLASESEGQEAGILGAGLAALSVIGEAVIPAVTSFLFDQAIKRAQQETLRKTASSTALSNQGTDDTFFTIGANPAGSGVAIASNVSCIVVVRKANADLPGAYTAKLDKINGGTTGSDFDPIRTVLNAGVPGLKLGSEEYPGLLAQFTVEPIAVLNDSAQEAEGGGFRLRPTLLAFGETGAKAISEENKKDLVIALTLDGFVPDKNALTQKSIYSNDFAFDGLPLGTVVRVKKDPVTKDEVVPAELVGKVGPIAVLPPHTFKANKENRHTNVPLKVTAVVTELEDGGDLERAIIEAVKAKKDDVTGPIDKALTKALQDALGQSDNSDGDGEDGGGGGS